MPDDAPKVLYVSFDVIPDPSGHSSRSTELLRGLSPVFNVDALTSKTPDHSHIERYYGVRLMRVPVGAGELPDRAQAFERAVRRQLESEEYPLVIFADPHGGYALCELKQRLGFKVIYLAAGFPSIELRYTHPELERERKFLAKLQRHELFCLMNADRVLVGAELTRQYAVGLGVQQERVQVLGPPVDRKLFERVPPVATDGPLRLLYLGSLAPWQGLPNLLFAFRQALQRCDARLSIVGPRGSAGQRKQLEDLVRDLKLAGKVELLNPVAHDDVPRLLAQCHALVAPLERGDRNVKQGAAPLKIAEALCAGRPVLTTDLPITKALMQDGVHGLFVRPGDAEDLSRAIAQLATDLPLRQRLGAAARAHALERFDADHGRRALLVAAHELIGRAMQIGEVEERSVDVDLYTVSNMPTTIGALPMAPAEVGALPMAPAEVGASADGPTQAVALPTPPGPTARRPKLRPNVASRSAREETNPGAKLPAPNVEIAPSVFAEDGASSSTGLVELPGGEPAARLHGDADEARPSPPSEPTPVGPAPAESGPPVAAQVDFTPVGPAPADPAIERAFETRPPPAPSEAVVSEAMASEPPPSEPTLERELTPVGPAPVAAEVDEPLRGGSGPAPGWPPPPVEAPERSWTPPVSDREPLAPLRLTTPVAPPRAPTLVGVPQPPPPRSEPPAEGAWASSPTVQAWPAAAAPADSPWASAPTVQLDSVGPPVDAWPLAPPPAAWPTEPARAAAPPPPAPAWPSAPPPPAWAAAPPSPPPTWPAAPPSAPPPGWSHAPSPGRPGPPGRPPALPPPHGRPPVLGPPGHAPPVLGPPPGWQAARPAPAGGPPNREPTPPAASDGDWFDRLMNGEAPTAAPAHGVDDSGEEPSQVVVGAVLEDPPEGDLPPPPHRPPPRR